ncbi:MAG: UDPGP type 1 family protein [Fuerstiella sp.]|nr:UDPGP type 1 family protein [Fuerstiella sp.]
MNDSTLQKTEALLAQHHQQHLLRFRGQLSDSQIQLLLAQIRKIDFSLLAGAPKLTTTHNVSRADCAAAPSSVIAWPNSATDHQIRRNAGKTGCQLLSDAKIAVITVAGGQGSRLGFEHPKGMYPIGPKSDRTLFQIYAEQILARRRKHNALIPWYLMTSAATHDETIAFFERHKFFSLDRDTVFFFQQASLPAIDAETGAILMDSPGSLCLSPDGHGGMVTALQSSGCLEALKNQGVEHLFYHQVDNPTAIVCDPILLGLHATRQSQLTTLVVRKTGPEERMGVLVDIDGRTEIIEYTELTGEQAAAIDDNDQWIFWAGNTAIHVFRRDFLEFLTEDDTCLPLHRARKKVNCIDATGAISGRQERDAVKFERFIFDALPLAQRTLIVEGDRQREFNPVKNADGNDSPKTARAALSHIGCQWLHTAEQSVASGTVVEISPLLALTAEDLCERLTLGNITVEDLIG